MDALAALQFSLAPALASALLHAVWQDALLGLAAWLTLAAAPRSSAAARHAIGMGFLLAMVLVPALSFAHFWQVPVTVVGKPLPALATAQGTAVLEQVSSPVPLVLALLWLLGVAVMLLRHANGWNLLRMLEKDAFEPLPDEWQQRFTRLHAAMGIGRTVVVRLSSDVVGPCTARLIRPVIWLPLSLLMRLPDEQVEALLAHELAHVARMDWLWNGLQCIVESLLFFHPAAWWLGRRVREEREHACDDLAVSASGDAIALAEALVQLAHHRPPVHRVALAAHGGSLMKRIKRLLSAPSPRTPWGVRAAIAAVLVICPVLAVQLGVAAGGMPGLQIRSTAEGVLGPGDMREISTRGIDGDRYYRATVDTDGDVVEIHEHNGRRVPLDAGARAWIADITRLTTAQSPPSPASPSSPASPASPASP